MRENKMIGTESVADDSAGPLAWHKYMKKPLQSQSEAAAKLDFCNKRNADRDSGFHPEYFVP